MNATQTTAGLILGLQKAYSRKWSFLGAFVIVLFLTLVVCNATGFIPDATTADAAGTVVTTHAPVDAFNTAALVGGPGVATSGTTAPTNGTLNMNGELPVKVTIPSINLSAKVANPATLNVDALDQYLLSGAARYPTSATLDQNGTVVLFGHSSYLPVVINQAFKTFDGIQNLKTGDQIHVYSATNEYTYAVQSVQKESEASGDGIPLTTTGHTLVLATCNSFATKSDRFVVTATLVGSSPLGS